MARRSAFSSARCAKRVRGAAIFNSISREALRYIIAGALTTLVSYETFWLFVDILGGQWALAANTISFIAAVIFAFVINKFYVFRSKSWGFSVLKTEIPAFLGVRLLSFAFEQAGIFVCVYFLQLHLHQVFGIESIKIAKVVLSFVVVAANYVLGRTIFKAGKEK